MEPLLGQITLFAGNFAPKHRGEPVILFFSSTKKGYQLLSILCCSGNRTRTCDLWVMSPTSYQLLHPAIYQLQLFRSGIQK